MIFKNKDIHNVLVYATSLVSKIIGEFKISGILSESPSNLWKKTSSHAGINKKIFFEYFENKQVGHAIRIKSSTRYEKPFSLKSFRVTQAPQSFMYLFADITPEIN